MASASGTGSKVSSVLCFSILEVYIYEHPVLLKQRSQFGDNVKADTTGGQPIATVEEKLCNGVIFPFHAFESEPGLFPFPEKLSVKPVISRLWILRRVL